ncbi:MAG: carbamate kinase [Acidobacteriota bacterium]
MPSRPVTAVIALGGNAFVRPGQKGTIAEQFANTRAILTGVVELVKRGYQIVLTHGNGPQIGNSLIRNELGKGLVPDIPLGVLVADSEGGIGYMVEQSLLNKLRRAGIQRPVITLLTQVVIDPSDPSLRNPEKPVGPFYTAEQAGELRARGYPVVEDSGRGYRRVVPSPYPLEIVEKDAIRLLLASGCIVIAAGGGGIPVMMEPDSTLEGVDAVIDKDLASMVLARDIGADVLLMLTAVDRVYLDFGKPGQRGIDEITVAEAKDFLAQGTFPAGSMAPKIRAGVEFLETGGRMACIGLGEEAEPILEGKRGTRIVA